METVQLNRRSDGKVMATPEQKQAVIDLVDSGRSSAEVARAHGLTIQTVVRWRREGVRRSLRFEKQPEVLIDPSNVKEMLAEIRRLSEENQKLRKTIGNVAYDRDILQEAYSIAVKKKWI